MNELIENTFLGIGGFDLVMTGMRVTLGTFFAISGYHKLFNGTRHASLAETMRTNHIPLPRFNEWFVPTVEFLGGIALAVGFLASLAALGLLAICIVATCTDGRARVKSWKPLDGADKVDDYLYLPEVLYAIMLLAFISAGAGPFSLDWLLLDLLVTS